MTGSIQLPLQSLRPARIRELQTSSLCLSYDKRGIHILFDRLEDSSKAILLNGDHAFQSFDVDRTHSWKGLAIFKYDIVVDVSSAIDTENQWPPLGAISLTPDGVLMRVAEIHHGFLDEIGLKLSIECPTIDRGLHASFTRWAFRFGDTDDPQFLWIEAQSATRA